MSTQNQDQPLASSSATQQAQQPAHRIQRDLLSAKHMEHRERFANPNRSSKQVKHRLRMPEGGRERIALQIDLDFLEQVISSTLITFSLFAHTWQSPHTYNAFLKCLPSSLVQILIDRHPARRESSERRQSASAFEIPALPANYDSPFDAETQHMLINFICRLLVIVSACHVITEARDHQPSRYGSFTQALANERLKGLLHQFPNSVEAAQVMKWGSTFAQTHLFGPQRFLRVFMLLFLQRCITPHNHADTFYPTHENGPKWPVATFIAALILTTDHYLSIHSKPAIPMPDYVVQVYALATGWSATTDPDLSPVDNAMLSPEIIRHEVEVMRCSFRGEHPLPELRPEKYLEIISQHKVLFGIVPAQHGLENPFLTIPLASWTDFFKQCQQHYAPAAASALQVTSHASQANSHAPQPTRPNSRPLTRNETAFVQRVTGRGNITHMDQLGTDPHVLQFLRQSSEANRSNLAPIMQGVPRPLNSLSPPSHAMGKTPNTGVAPQQSPQHRPQNLPRSSAPHHQVSIESWPHSRHPDRSIAPRSEGAHLASTVDSEAYRRRMSRIHNQQMQATSPGTTRGQNVLFVDQDFDFQSNSLVVGSSTTLNRASAQVSAASTTSHPYANTDAPQKSHTSAVGPPSSIAPPVEARPNFVATSSLRTTIESDAHSDARARSASPDLSRQVGAAARDSVSLSPPPLRNPFVPTAMNRQRTVFSRSNEDYGTRIAGQRRPASSLGALDYPALQRQRQEPPADSAHIIHHNSA